MAPVLDHRTEQTILPLGLLSRDRLLGPPANVSVFVCDVIETSPQGATLDWDVTMMYRAKENKDCLGKLFGTDWVCLRLLRIANTYAAEYKQ